MNLNLASERLDLTPLSMKDVELWITLRSNPEVMKYIAPPRSEEQLRKELPGRCLRAGGGAIGFWKISERKTGDGIGTALLLPLPIEDEDTNWAALGREDYPEEEIELGYNFLPRAWGKGYATETARTLLDFAFTQTQLEKVVAVTDAENAASQAVLRKSGMKDTGVARAYGEDLPGFEISKEDWLASQPAG